MRSDLAPSSTALAKRLENLGFLLPFDAISGLALYLGQLMKWNKAMNLVGANSWEETVETLIADSFHLEVFLRSLPLAPNPEVFDLGAGAGLPGIPLRLVWHEGNYTLVEAREKRALFMRTTLASLALERTEVFQGRAEAFFQKSGKADCIISRAFMPWRDLLAFIENALSPDGLVIFLTLEPAPEGIPAPWRLAAQTDYAIRDARRHFWAFTREAR